MENFRRLHDIRRKVLVVEDEFINREILGAIVGEHYAVSYAENGRQALELLHKPGAAFSLILLDLLMPEMDGFEFIARMREDEVLRSIPVIVITSEKDAEAKSIRLGAADFITKPYDMPEIILARCERIIELAEGQRIIRSTERDDLTELYSKEFFFEYIRQIEEYNPDAPMDAMVLDINHFHLINELYGRETGDTILQRTAGILTQIFKDKWGIFARPEADTFYICCEHLKEPEALIEQIQSGLNADPELPKTRIRVGVYANVDKTVVTEARFDRAKYACDQLRGDFSAQVFYYSDELHTRSVFQEQLINDIDDAIRNHDLVVYFQPKFNIQGDSPRLCSAEALIRWKHPQMGMISPGEFVPLFEQNGLIQKLDRFVWSETAAKIREWKEEYGVSIPVSVNVSRVDIYDPDLEERLLELLREHNLTPSDMMLEVTESAYADNAKRLVEVVNNLRERGFRIEMDDFGSGYSSLNMLTTIPIDVLKMDMKFIQNMLKDPTSMKLVELVLEIASFLDVPVVAEGVEEVSQLEELKKRGCAIIQGYYFSKPLPPEEFRSFIEEEVRIRELA